MEPRLDPPSSRSGRVNLHGVPYFIFIFFVPTDVHDIISMVADNVQNHLLFLAIANALAEGCFDEAAG